MHIAQLCGAAWSSRWLMVQLTNGQYTCKLVFKLKADILNIRCDYQFVFSVLDKLYASHHAWCNRCLRVHYKSMKCDVLFSQGSVCTLFRWGGHFSYMSKKISSSLQQCKNYNNWSRFSKVMVTNVLPPFLWFTVYIAKLFFLLYSSGRKCLCLHATTPILRSGPRNLPNSVK